ncbi:MAG: MFS transporter [Flavobacteriaceae bacterium]|nr:MFS transporter [Flavobacteriaceae bacterium]MDG1246921.1 MFS transporter [Flavobacteriaceae bacterium]
MFNKKTDHPRGSKKLIGAWTLYDWSNSVYSLVISSAVFPIYYSQYVFSQTNSIILFNAEINKDSLISLVSAFSFLLIAFLSPLLSGIADYIGNKKIFMKFFVYLGSLSCIGLYWFELETIEISLIFYTLTLIGFWGSLVYYNSYLRDITYPNQTNVVSAKGYTMGYIGSVILLLINLIMINFYESFGFESEIIAMKSSFAIVGLWWLGFSQYSFYHLPKGNRGVKIPKNIIWNGFKELKNVYKIIRSSKRFTRFLIAFFVFSFSLQTVLYIASYFGVNEIDWTGSDQTSGLIISILLIQIVAIAGAFIFSRLAQKFGNVIVLTFAIFLWGAVCLYAYYINTPNEFYMIAGLVGLLMGGTQPVARATFSLFIPDTNDTTSFFSFYDVTEKIGIVFGMLFYALAAQITGSVRFSVIIFMFFFFLGAILLTRVPRIDKNKLA